MSDKPQYTPGPWNPSRNYIVNAARGLEADRRGESWKDRHGEFEDTVADNANLIAAAPDMYVALATLVRWVSLDITEMEQACDRGRAALQKARGE